MSKSYKDISGQKFNRWTVLKYIGIGGSGGATWLCRCDCGTERNIDGRALRAGKSKSCGCLQRELATNLKTTHGKSHTRLFGIWTDMIRRCVDERREAYKNYGGRGITVCQEWQNDFMLFYNWSVANGYRDDLSIDRINNDGNYEPDNCKWSTRIEQMNNTRNNLHITIGEETHTATEWSRIIGIKPSIIKRTFSSKGKLLKPLNSVMVYYPHPNQVINMQGLTFNRLTIMAFDHKSEKTGSMYWLCKCECGNEKVIDGRLIRNGNTKSCGCLKQEFKTKTKEQIQNN